MNAARAVGRVEATNPIPLVIPCHRVLGSDGSLHGYGGPGGIKLKAWLLQLEGAVLKIKPASMVLAGRLITLLLFFKPVFFNYCLDDLTYPHHLHSQIGTPHQKTPG